MAFFCKSYENVLIWVFLHAEFIFALKTEPKSMVFEKHAKNEKNKYLSSLFSIFCDFLLDGILDGKMPNIAKLVDINFLADNEKNRQAIGFAKMEG